MRSQGSQRAPKMAQVDPKMGQVGPKMGQVGPKMAKFWLRYPEVGPR